jgi:hypothetical protein
LRPPEELARSPVLFIPVHNLILPDNSQPADLTAFFEGDECRLSKGEVSHVNNLLGGGMVRC